ncbi:MAG: winged helix-turn-helix domain-containing protein, partial [Chloroflexota bacterium]
DDYLTTPFGAKELLARVHVGLRHAAKGQAGAVFRTGELEVDLDRRSVKVAGHDLHLTPTEYEILKTFIANPGRVVTDQALLRKVWGPGYGDEAHYLHVYMARLRKKLESGSAHRYLATEPGVGYRLVVEDA